MDFTLELPMLLFTIFMLGLAGFVDASAGGGGLISIPTYMFTGMPVHLVYGTNKFTSASGTTLATLKYLKSGMIDVKIALIAAAFSFLGSTIGSHVVLYIQGDVLEKMLLVVLPVVAVFILCRRKTPDVNQCDLRISKKKVAFAAIIGLAIGMYDALFGPGTGTFALIAFNVIMKYDLKYSNGNAKVINLASNIASLITYWMAGNVYLTLAIPCALANILGAHLGSKFVITKGAKFVRPMMTVVIILLMGKIILSLF